MDHVNDTETFYQMVVMHQDHGRNAISHPFYDLGQFTPKDAYHLANFLLACCQQQDKEMFEGVVGNIIEAWGSLSYRCWLLPLEKERCVLEICGEGIVEVPSYHDPR